MRHCPDRDRLAVWTYEEAGEEIAAGDPSVTDAERAVAGRETLAERFAAVLPGNRSRAASQYGAAGLPDGQDMVRVWGPRDPAALRSRLTEPPLAIWSEDDVLHVLWQGHADEVQLYGGVQPRLWPVTGPDDLWEVSLRIRRLDRAVISMVVASRRAGGDWPTRIPDVRVWRGPRAPAAAPPRELRGTVETHTLPSAALRAERELIAAGFSNGTVWAIAAAQRRPDLIGAVAAFSAGVVPQRISGAARSASVRHYLVAGSLEPGFRRSTRQWAERLGRAGLPCRHEELTGGHDQVWWERQLPVALGWLLQA
jgi:hypothetical protein